MLIKEGKLATSYSQIDMFLSCPLKWYNKYVLDLGETEKSEALCYGSAVHYMLEMFFRSNKLMNGPLLSECWDDYTKKNEIPYDSLESMLQCAKDNVNTTTFLLKLKEKQDTRIGNLFKYASVAGVEEQFNLKYKLPNPTVVDNITYSHVSIIGFIDLILKYKDKFYIVDHKSGNKLFKEDKLATNLQFPIYSMVMLRERKTLPENCYYFFTRHLTEQNVKVDMERINSSVTQLNSIFKKMYNFKSDENKTARPTSLCFWCQYKHSENCRQSSKWEPNKP